MKILVVEDDRAVAQTLQLLFSSHNYAVDLAADGEAGLEMAEAFAYDLILLDVLLPKLDGVSLCQHLRAQGCQSPILLLTGQGGGEQKAIALNAGADDYVVKPFDAGELVARVQALLRRGKSTGQPILTWSHLSLDPNSRKVTYDTHLLELTPKEYAILELFLRYPQTVFSARAILDHGWPATESPGEEAVRAHIKEMRQKFAAVGAPKDLIKTVYRVGYRLNPLYSASLIAPGEPLLTPSQIAELKSVHEQLRVSLEQVRSTQAELERKNQELQTVRDELEQRVADRTAELGNANQSLQQQQEQWQALFDLALDAITIADDEGRYVDINPATCKLFGVAREDLLRLSVANFADPAVDITQVWQQFLQQGQMSGEFRLHRPDGTTRETEFNAIANFVPGRHLSILRDISDRKQSEATIAADLRDTQLLQHLSTRLITETNIQVLYDEIVTTAIALMHSNMGSLQILDQSRNELYLQSYRGFHPDAAAFWQRVSVETGCICGVALEQGERMIIPDIETCDVIAGTASLDYYRLCEIRASQSTPLITRSGQLIGMFSTYWCTPYQPSDRELRFLDLLARQATDLIEQRQSQDALSHNHAMFSALVRNAPFGIYLIDADFRLQQINKGAEAVFSHIDPLIGRDFGEILRILWQEPFATEAINHFQHTLASGESYYSPVIVEPRANINEIQAYDWQIHRITFPDGTYGAVCYFYDLSEIKRTEAALHENQQLLRLAMAGAQAGTWDWVLATGKLTWSPETYRLYGLDPDTPPRNYDNWYQNVLHPDDRIWVKNYIAQMIAQRQPDLRLEFRILHPQHGIRWILGLAHLTVNEQGEPVRLSGMNLDISDRKQLETNIQTSEERLRLALDLNAIGMWEWQMATGTVTWNDYNYHLLGYQPGEVEPGYHFWHDPIHPDDVAEVDRAIAQALANQTDFTIEFRVVLQDGSIRWLLGKGRGIYDEAGQPVRMLGVSLDISDRKQAEITLQQQLARERLVADLSQEIRQSLDLNSVLSRTVERVREILAVDRVIIFRFRPDWQGDVIMESVGAEWPPILSTTIFDPCFRDHYIKPYGQGRLAIISDIDAEDREACYVELLQQFQVKAIMVLPIMQDEALWGLLIAHQCSAPRQWQPSEIDCLQQLATHVGIAIQQSELYQRTQDELAERERMQTVLEESKERFRTLSESAPIGICQTNADGICLYTNTHWQEMSGLSFAENLGNGWLQAIHPIDRATLSSAWEAYLQGGSDRLPEFRLLTPTGEVRWVAARVATIRSAAGDILGYVSTNEDITERKQAEEALLASEQRLQDILDHSPAVIYLIDPQNKHLLVNRSYAALLSTAPEQLIGQSIYDVWSQQIADAFADHNRQVLETGQLIQIEEMASHPDGPHTYFTVKFPLCDADGIPYAVCGISTDITDKKRLEAQFHHAQRLESLGTLTSGIAHDLNNVLTPILAIAQLLRLKKLNLDARSQEMLKVLEDSARRGADLVKQILTFTRGSEEKRTPVQVATLLPEVLNLVQKTFPKSITIRETLSAEAPDLVLANATQLHQVLMNLCVNARDAMPNGGVLSVSIDNVEVNELFARRNLDAQVGRYVVIIIADTGTGIAPDVRDRIFDPFFTTKPFGQGTGLGLSTVLGIVRNYGGFVEVESQPGVGSQFKVYLPALKTAVPLSQDEAAPPQGQGELILVVDDEEAILQSTQEILETYHYRVLTATNGRDAIACYAHHQNDIHVVLMDMMMPGLDGLMTIRALQDMNPQVKVIATSGLAGQYRQSLQALGITALLTKPFTTADLLQSLTKSNGSTKQTSPYNQV